MLLIAVLVPVTAHSLYLDQPLPAAAGGILSIVLLANIWLLSKNREAFLTPPQVILLSMSLVLLQATWQRYARPATLLMLDIDFFKRIDDRFGHSAGDTVIKDLVEVILGRIRSVDTLCRYGGEECAVPLNDTGPEAAVVVAGELRERVENAPILPEGNATVTIGVCGIAASGNLDHRLKLADGAL